MKIRNPQTKPFFTILLCVLLAALSAHARTWTSADGKSTFEGELIEYHAKTGQVTVNRGGKTVTFKEQMLSAGDIAFLKNGKLARVFERRDLEGRHPMIIAQTLMEAFTEHCGKTEAASN